MLDLYNGAMNRYLSNVQFQLELFKHNSVIMAYIIVALVAIQLINLLTRYRLNLLGIHPRRLIGLPGVVLSPLLHANFKHLFANLLPFCILGLFVLQMGYYYFIWVTLVITLISGLAVWLLGRNAIHIGASGLIMGYFSFLLVQAYFAPSVVTIALAAVTLYYFAGLFLGLFPSDITVSWEGHLLGFIAGIIVVFCNPFFPYFLNTVRNFSYG